MHAVGILMSPIEERLGNDHGAELSRQIYREIRSNPQSDQRATVEQLGLDLPCSKTLERASGWMALIRYGQWTSLVSCQLTWPSPADVMGNL